MISWIIVGGLKKKPKQANNAVVRVDCSCETNGPVGAENWHLVADW